ncbi:hypothetical protein IU440_28825 [Nocardia cyriacigeorgica]|uniref:hypothetical protein n=1 Tax=Nocardia cyriacigeorgica TaxID=135487 RepID=UPI0018952CCF|nr:hypothetical protein [Nocardia cyriacigeorgica]MBF6428683.1 hypothetical protein [Nocardia cyriacigeorgica]
MDIPTPTELNESLTYIDVKAYLEEHPFEPFVLAQGADGELGVFFAKDWAMFYGVPGVRYAGLL